MSNKLDVLRYSNLRNDIPFSDHEYPFVSVIMPVRNEAGYIERSLKAVFDQDYPRDRMEIIVADGMSKDGTREYIQSIQTDHPKVHLIDNPGEIAPTGLNAAIQNAKGSIIIRVDGHCEIAKDYISRCVENLVENDVDGVGGPLETIGENFTSRIIAAAMSSTFGVGGSAFRTVKDKSLLVDSVAFPAYSRSTIEKAGPFDEELVRNQDDEYNYRIRKLNGRILLTPDIRSKYYSRGSLTSLWRQYFQYGFWKVRVMQKHPLQMSLRQFVPGLFVISMIILSVLALFIPSAGWFLLGIIVAYGISNIISSALTAIKTHWSYILLLPIVYLILHISYGLGFIIGLVKFFKYFNLRDRFIHALSLTPGTVIRRFLDLSLSLMGLFILSPFLFLIAVLIKNDSPGPVFYRGKRAGRNGRIFNILKFRTMYERTESYNGPKVTAQDDPRITSLGRWLRDTKINELPQLWNVVKGEMSLVGPRPEDPDIAAQWPEDIRKEILSVRPGITSPASILYRDEETLLKSETVMDKYLWDILPSKLRFDQLYVRNRTILSDLDVVFWTVFVLLPRLNRLTIPEHLLYWGPLSQFISRYLSWFITDILVSYIAIAFAGVLWRISAPLDLGLSLAMSIALAIAFLFSFINSVMRLDRTSWKLAGGGDAMGLALSSGTVTLILFIVNLLWPVEPLLPPGMLVMAGMFSFFGFVAVRYRSRLLTGLASRWLSLRAGQIGSLGERVLIVGSGEAGQFAAWLINNGSLSQAFTIVGLVDDNPRKIGMQFDGMAVLGSTTEIPEIVNQHDIGLILFAIVKIHPDEQARILELCQNTPARILMIPDVLETLRAHFPSDKVERDRAVDNLIHNTTTDKVTGAYNRQQFIRIAREELPRSRRYNRPLSLILFSIEYPPTDGKLNQHTLSSKILKSVAESSRKVIREVDILGRMSSNEFAILLPETDIDAAYRIADRLKTILSEIQLGINGSSLRINVSSSVVAAQNANQDIESLFEHAEAGILNSR